MTLFDLIALVVIGISAMIGFSRGAVRELVGLFAFAIAAFAALYLLPITGPIARGFIHGGLLVTAAAIIGGFAAVYLGFKLVGHFLATQLHQQTVLGGADRSLGLGIGAVRALILLGLFALVFEHATPPEMKPAWITNAFLYPLSSASGRILGAFAPTGLKAVGQFSPLFKGATGTPSDQTPPSENDAVRSQTPAPSTNHLVNQDQPAHKGALTGKGYGKHARDSVDALVEKTR